MEEVDHDFTIKLQYSNDLMCGSFYFKGNMESLY